MDRINQYDFSENQPKVGMRIVTKIERVQPYMIGVDRNGQMIWEGREMPRWQMELLRVTPQWFGDFFMRWMELTKLEQHAIEFKAEHSFLPSIEGKSKQLLNQMRIDHQPKKKYWKTVSGD